MKMPEIFSIKKFDIGIAIFATIFLLGVIGPYLYTASLEPSPNREQPPSYKYPLGTDSLGRDVFGVLLISIRGSLYVGFIASLIALSLALFLGSIAGIFGGIVDKVIMTISEVFLLIPSLLLMLILTAYLPKDVLSKFGPMIVGIVIGVTSWAGWARGFRSLVMTISTKEFIQLSYLNGVSRLSIIVRDVLPLIAPYTLAALAMLFSSAVMSEVGLSLILGLSFTEQYTLGIMLYISQIYFNIAFGFWWTFAPPSIVIVLIFVSLYLVATSLDEYFNPRIRSI